MDTQETDRDDRERELERYREAATRALDQLEWCIDYLYRVRKPHIARAIAHNRTQILERLREARGTAPGGGPSEPHDV
jgi:hypothetical protein